ncbi:MAG: hypothetical protein HQ500_02770 [Flavobacteriales bacterium]|nr:hypothetical protein [Flavobacteriales bacterium]
MKTLAIILTLVSGLYFNGQANAEGVKTDTTHPDSSGMTAGQLNILENVSIEAGEAADALLSNPSYSAPEKLQEEKTSTEFLMKLTSMNAAKAAEEIRVDIEE